jgi:hypothetical protein
VSCNNYKSAGAANNAATMTDEEIGRKARRKKNEKER